MAEAMPTAPEAVRRLDVSVLHALVLERIFGITPEQVKAGGLIEYTIDALGALDRVGPASASGAFLMNPPTIGDVEAVSDVGAVMPEKSTYFYPKLLTGLVKAVRPLGLATGEAGFNCDFHAIRHHGDQAVLEKHYVPRRSQRTRAVLTFFAQDHAAGDMAYSNADITKAEQAAEIIAFADYWKNATGSDPGLLVFDSQLTTYKILGISGQVRQIAVKKSAATSPP